MDDPPGEALSGTEEVDHVPMSVPDVEDDRHVQVAGQVQLLAEHPLLHVPGAEIIVIVQADLPDGDDPVLPGQLPQPVQIALRRFRRLVRVDAAGSPGVFVGLGEADAGFGRGQVRPDADDAGNAPVPQALEGFLPVRVKFFIVQVAVGVK